MSSEAPEFSGAAASLDTGSSIGSSQGSASIQSISPTFSSEFTSISPDLGGTFQPNMSMVELSALPEHTIADEYSPSVNTIYAPQSLVEELDGKETRLTDLLGLPEHKVNNIGKVVIEEIKNPFGREEVVEPEVVPTVILKPEAEESFVVLDPSPASPDQDDKTAQILESPRSVYMNRVPQNDNPESNQFFFVEESANRTQSIYKPENNSPAVQKAEQTADLKLAEEIVLQIETHAGLSQDQKTNLVAIVEQTIEAKTDPALQPLEVKTLEGEMQKAAPVTIAEPKVSPQEFAKTIFAPAPEAITITSSQEETEMSVATQTEVEATTETQVANTQEDKVATNQDEEPLPEELPKKSPKWLMYSVNDKKVKDTTMVQKLKKIARSMVIRAFGRNSEKPLEDIKAELNQLDAEYKPEDATSADSIANQAAISLEYAQSERDAQAVLELAIDKADPKKKEEEIKFEGKVPTDELPEELRDAAETGADFMFVDKKTGRVDVATSNERKQPLELDFEAPEDRIIDRSKLNQTEKRYNMKADPHARQLLNNARQKAAAQVKISR